MSKHKTGIYKILNIVTGDFYIGSASVSFTHRWKRHQYDLRKNKHCNIHLQRAWNKHGEVNFSFIILRECHKDVCINIEQIYLDSLNPLYNICKIANSKLNVPHTLETRKKMSNSHMGKKHSEEHRINNSKARKGVKRPYLSNNLEWRRKFGKPVLCVELNKIFHTAKEASEFLNVCNCGIGRCLQGKLKTSGGYHWIAMTDIQDDTLDCDTNLLLNWTS